MMNASTSQPQAEIDVRGLTRRFRDVVAVNDVSFQVVPGAVFGLLGPNGAGKSTVIKMLTTILPPTGGTALIAGYDIQKQAYHVRRRIGYVPQMLSADGDLTGRENLLIFSELYGLRGTRRKVAIDDALALMNLKGAADARVKTYSGGMIRRLEIAQAMLHQPAILFLDEPTIGLDPAARKDVWEHFQTIRSRTAMTVLLTTHYMEEADRLCDTIAFMHLGKIVGRGTPQALRASLGTDATLDDVFIELTGDEDERGKMADARRERRAFMGR